MSRAGWHAGRAKITSMAVWGRWGISGDGDSTASSWRERKFGTLSGLVDLPCSARGGSEGGRVTINSKPAHPELLCGEQVRVPGSVLKPRRASEIGQALYVLLIVRMETSSADRVLTPAPCMEHSSASSIHSVCPPRALTRQPEPLARCKYYRPGRQAWISLAIIRRVLAIFPTPVPSPRLSRGSSLVMPIPGGPMRWRHSDDPWPGRIGGWRA